MPRYCSNCGSAMSESASFCPACGRGAGQGSEAERRSLQHCSNVPDWPITWLECWLTSCSFPAIVFLLVEPYNRRVFVRFHAFQCLFFAGALVTTSIVLSFIPILGWIASFFISLAAFVTWIVLLIKAYGGEKFKLPVIGDLAEKQANI
jgi:uncharacterized membrane protein